MHILIVEDNQDLAANLIDYLSLKNYVVDCASNGRQALSLIEQHHFNAIILDVMLPGMSGLEVCSDLRSKNIITPVLFLTARDTLDNKLEGFEVGGDDYLVKPFEMEELCVRLEALCKRTMKTKNNILSVSDLTFNLDTLEVNRAGQRLRLNRSCLIILQYLIERSPEVVTREELGNILWQDDHHNKNILRSHLYNLRAILDKPFDTPLIHTVHGKGFCLKP